MTRVLVPIAVLDGESVPHGLISLLCGVDVTLLGYHVLPDQTPPDQARLQFEERATAALEDVVREFSAAGGAADHRLVFTHDREQTVRRVTDEVDADAFVVPGTTGDVDRILVSLSGDVDVDRILSFVESLVGERPTGVTLFLAAGERPPAGDADATDADAAGEPDAVAVAGDAPSDAARLAAAADRLRGAGIDVETTLAAAGSPFDALVDAASGHDAVVMGERAPSLRSLVFGEESDRVAAASVGPVLVVRGRRGTAATDGDATPAGDE